MIITAVEIKVLFETGTKLRAIANLTFDDMIVLHDIKVLEDSEKKFLAMPSKMIKPFEYRDIVHPINSDARTAIENIIFSVYNEAISENVPLLNVRMIINDGENLITQNCEKFEIYNPKTGEKKVADERLSFGEISKKKAEQVTNNGNNEFVNWLKN